MTQTEGDYRHDRPVLRHGHSARAEHVPDRHRTLALVRDIETMRLAPPPPACAACRKPIRGPGGAWARALRASVCLQCRQLTACIICGHALGRGELIECSACAPEY